MNDPDAARYLVKDISETVEGGSWRWSFRRPEMQFYLQDVEGYRLAVELSLAEATIRDTGPVAVSFFVHGHLLATVPYATAGQKRFDKAVPPGILNPNAFNRVSLRPSKVWIAGDGAALGLILTEAGFHR
jgi:hypothetical protein